MPNESPFVKGSHKSQGNQQFFPGPAEDQLPELLRAKAASAKASAMTPQVTFSMRHLAENRTQLSKHEEVKLQAEKVSIEQKLTQLEQEAQDRPNKMQQRALRRNLWVI